jgi:hypothetical protein
MNPTLKPGEQDDLLGSEPRRKRQGRIARSYEWFLELPVPIVLAVMWLAGVGLISVGVMALYLFWLALAGIAGG